MLASAAPTYSAGKIIELDEANFAAAIDDFDGLAVVEFYAPWCRTCRNVAPRLASTVAKISSEQNTEDVRFFKVNFKANKNLCLRERVFALPAVHFYTSSLGRINRFLLTPTSVAKRMESELDRYLGESGHLAFLKTLETRQSEGSPLSPLFQYSSLVGLLQALANAEKYLTAAETADSEFLNKALDKDKRRLEQLRSLFDVVDSNGDGVIDADELAAVAAAVGPLAAAGGDEAAPLLLNGAEFYGTLLERAVDSIAAHSGNEERNWLGRTSSSALTFGAFVKLMESREVSEFRATGDEMRAAFESMDANGDGVITRDEMLAAIDAVVQNLPTPDGNDWAKEVEVAFDAMDRNKSGSLDYEEFVAVLSGAAYTYGD